jgi:outer membrane protease
MYGTLYEIAYQNSETDRYLSELQWEQKPLVYQGFDFLFGPRSPQQDWGFFIGSSLKAAVPMQTGSVEDRDWIAADGTALSHFSAHDNKTLGAFFFNLNSGFSFPLWKVLVVQLPLSFDYQFIKMVAMDGYTQYGPNGSVPPPGGSYQPWNPAFPKKAFNGSGISYSQHWFILSPGLVLAANLGRFTLSASFKISPLVAAIAIDDHMVREILFTDLLVGGLYLEPAAGLSFNFNRRFRIGADFSYRRIKGTRGNEIVEYYGSNGDDESDGVALDCGGAGMELFEGSIFLNIRI